jgi:hypothetical protein
LGDVPARLVASEEKVTQLDRLAARMTELLGEPVVLPEDSEMYRLTHVRTWSWPCPRCLAGADLDVLLQPCSRGHGYLEGGCDCPDSEYATCRILLSLLFPYRPFTLKSDGAVYCVACRATEDQLIQAVRLRGL